MTKRYKQQKAFFTGEHLKEKLWSLTVCPMMEIKYIFKRLLYLYLYRSTTLSKQVSSDLKSNA